MKKHYFGANNVELKFGDILSSDNIYPFCSGFDAGEPVHNYYGIVMLIDGQIVIRTTIKAHSSVQGISDGNCGEISRFANDNGVLKILSK